MAAGAVQLVDVGTRSEFDAAHIDGARSIPFDELRKEVMTLDRERPLLFCSGHGETAAIAARTFREAGLTAAALRGGLDEWRIEGLPLVRRASSKQETTGG